MQIGIDARSFSINKTQFLDKLISSLSEDKEMNTYNIYVNKEYNSLEKNHNIKITYIDSSLSYINEQMLFTYRLFKDNNDFVIFLDISKPILYVGKSIQLIHSLKELSYPTNKTTGLNKYKYNFKLKHSLKTATKIICYSKQTKLELNERLNIDEKKINILPAFFIQNINESKQSIDVKIKYSINNNYLIFIGEPGTSNNFEKTIKILGELKNISLVVLGNKLSSDIEIRESIIRNNFKNIIFIGNQEKEFYYEIYKQSTGVIFPSLYESFPFILSNALYTNTPILASEINGIFDILDDNINYFSPQSSKDIEKSINNLINRKEVINYSEILKKYSSENFINGLNEVIKKI